MRAVIVALLMLLLSVAVSAQDRDVFIGDGSAKSKLYPINRHYNYSRWEGIYLASEIQDTGFVKSISFYKDNKDNGQNIKEVRVYMKLTPNSTLQDGTWDLSGYSLVFTGKIINSASKGWKTIVLDQPFHLPAGSNLQIGIEHGFQRYTNDFPLWSYTTYPGNKRSRHGENDNNLPVNLKAKTGRPNIWIKFGCLQPLVDAGSDKYICSAGIVTLGGNPTATGGHPPYNYMWSPSTALNDPTISNPTSTASAPETYQVVVTDSYGCASSPDSIFLLQSSEGMEFKGNTDLFVYTCQSKFYDSGGKKKGYKHNEDYFYVFYPCDSTSYLKLNFDNFDLEESQNCIYDYLLVYDGPDSTSSLLGRFCGSNLPGELSSSHPSGAISFYFHSDKNVSGDGWGISFECLCRPPLAFAGNDKTICQNGNVILGGNPAASGGIPPYSYTWTPSDGLDKTDIPNPVCSSTRDITYTLIVKDSKGCTSLGDSVFVHVNTDNDVFLLNGNKSYIACQGRFFDSGGERSGYLYNEHYVATFFPCDTSKTIVLDFLFFDLEYNPKSHSDYMKIYNGPDVQSPLIGHYDGSSNPGYILSTHPSGAITVEFFSDNILSGKGWEAYIKCDKKKCTQLAGLITIDGSTNTCSSFLGSVDIDYNQGTVLEWQYSYDNKNYSMLDFPASLPFSYQINTTTYFRVKSETIDGVCFSNWTKAVTGNNYYINDNSTDNDHWCTRIGNNGNSGLSPDLPVENLTVLFEKYDIKGCDSIFVDIGQYTKEVVVTGSDIGSSASPIAVVGASVDSTVVSGASGNYVMALKNTSYISFANLCFNGNGIATNAIISDDSKNISVYNCSMKGSKGPVVYLRSKAVLSNYLFENCNIVSVSDNSNNIETSGFTDSLIVNNCLFSNGGLNSVGMKITNCNYIQIENNRFNIENSGIVVKECQLRENSIISSNIININNSNGVNCEAISLVNISADSCTVIGNEIAGSTFGILLGSNSGSISLINNRISHNALGIKDARSAQGSVNYYSYYNTVYSYENAISCSYSDDWSLFNNIFVAVNHGAVPLMANSSAFSRIDNNLYYCDDPGRCACVNGQCYNLTQWKELLSVYPPLSNDNNSGYSDPLFRNIEIGSFQPGNNSFAINHGLSLNNVNYDIDLTPRKNPSTIGAYEVNDSVFRLVYDINPCSIDSTGSITVTETEGDDLIYLWEDYTLPTSSDIDLLYDSLPGLAAEISKDSLASKIIRCFKNNSYYSPEPGVVELKVIKNTTTLYDGRIILGERIFWNNPNHLSVGEDYIVNTSQNDEERCGVSSYNVYSSKAGCQVYFTIQNKSFSGVIGFTDAGNPGSPPSGLNDFVMGLLFREGKMYLVQKGQIQLLSDFSDNYDVKLVFGTNSFDVEHNEKTLISVPAGVGEFKFSAMLFSKMVSIQSLGIIPIWLTSPKFIVKDANCLNGHDGEITGIISNPFWTNVSFTWTDPQGNVIPNTSNHIAGLSVGTYTVVISYTIFGQPHTTLPILIMVGYEVAWKTFSNVDYDPVNRIEKIDNTSVNPLTSGCVSFNNSGPNTKLKVEYTISSTNPSFAVRLGLSDQFPEDFSSDGPAVFLIRIFNSFSCFCGTNLGNSVSLGVIPTTNAKILISRNIGGTFSFRLNNNPVFTPSPAINSTSNMYINPAIYYQNSCVTYTRASFPCALSINDGYAKLRKQMDAGYYTVNSGGELLFCFDEEYYDVNGVLNYVIYPVSNNKMAGAALATLTSAYGDNRYALNVQSLQSGYYILEVRNEKDEKWFLRFQR